MTDRHHLLVYGGTFAAVGDRGDISGVRGSGVATGSPEGLFVRDARHLSRWQLTVDGAVPEVLSPVADGDTTRCVLVPRGGRNEPPSCTLFREQAVGDSSFVESLRVVSNRPVPTTVRLAVTADADFTDQFELRSDHRTYAKTGVVRRRQILDDGVEFTYRRGEWKSCTTVTAEPVPDGIEETGTGARRLVWKLELEPHGSAELTLRVMARPHGEKRALRVPRSPASVTGQLLSQEGEFVEGVAFPTGWPELAAACARGLADLASLQVQATGPDGEELRVPAAGAPGSSPCWAGTPCSPRCSPSPTGPARPPPRCSRSPRPRPPRPGLGRCPSPARSCTRCGTASSPTSSRSRTAATTARWTRPRCSSSSSARMSSRPVM